MERKKAELEEFIATGYDFDALMDIGNGWEPYQGCTRNLLMILEDQDTTVQIVDENEEDMTQVFMFEHAPANAEAVEKYYQAD